MADFRRVQRFLSVDGVKNRAKNEEERTSERKKKFNIVKIVLKQRHNNNRIEQKKQSIELKVLRTKTNGSLARCLRCVYKVKRSRAFL